MTSIDSEEDCGYVDLYFVVSLITHNSMMKLLIKMLHVSNWIVVLKRTVNHSQLN